MKLIAHRGNVAGRSPHENAPGHIDAARALGFDVEVDLWVQGSRFLLGHDRGEYEVPLEFLLAEGSWIHCKNVRAVDAMIEAHAHWFWHEEDERTLTSRGVVWTYPGRALSRGAIAVCPELAADDWKLDVAGGICSDHVLDWRDKLMPGELSIESNHGPERCSAPLP
ncbi:MAG: hypothetical protein KDC95_14685 [Planctomycetes bacterium]|nr:hypothetical protein [Planctomycetota bacterium]